MNVSYKGIEKALAPKLQSKLDSKFTKLSKLLEQRGPKEARVVVATERGRHKAEVTMQFYGHPLVGAAADTDLFKALWDALEKLEVQAVKNCAKWREKQRRPEAAPQAAVVKTAKAKAPGSKDKGRDKGRDRKEDLVGVVSGSGNNFHENAVRIFRANHHDDHKPMTLDEALMEMDKDRDYVVYQDTGRKGVSVLVRRRDGHFDLIES